jgi:O-Antigen ligase
MGAEPSRWVATRRGHLIALGVGALLLAAVFWSGGTSDGAVLWIGGAGALLAAATVVRGVTSVGLPRLDRPGLVTAAALTGLILWAGVSVAWSIAGDLSWSALNKGLASGAFFAVGVTFAARAERATRALAGVVAAVLGLALAWALLGKAVPALFAGGTRTPRLRDPVGYANALALLADAAVVLGLWITVALGRRRDLRAAGALLVYLAVVATLLTSSRAGAVGAVVVFALWARFGGHALESGLVASVAGVPAAAVAGWAFTRPALVDAGQTHAARVHDGAVFAVLALVGAALAVGLALEVPDRLLLPGREVMVARGLVVAAVTAVVVAAVALAAVAGNPFVKAAHGFSRGECTNAPNRLTTLCTNNRLQWWREAWHVFTARPEGGTGAGTFQIARKRYRRNAEMVVEPHSVPLQVLAETGVVGGVLLVLLAGGAGIGVTRTITRLGGGERTAGVALAALPAAYAVHALVDYDVNFLAVTGPTLLVTGALLAAARPTVLVRGGPVVVAGAVALALAAIVSFGSPWLAERKVNDAYRAIDGLRLKQAVDDAKAARELDPLSLDPIYARALADLRAGDLTSAYARYLEAARLQPENPLVWFNLGTFELDQRQDACAAYQALNRAYTLDPQNSTYWTKGGALDQAKVAVNDKQHPACGR